MVADYLPLLLRGAGVSLCVMLVSLLVALLLGLVNALIKLFGPRWLRWFSTGYTTLVRGIPELVIMLLLFFGGEMLVNALLSLVDLGRCVLIPLFPACWRLASCLAPITPRRFAARFSPSIADKPKRLKPTACGRGWSSGGLCCRRC
jgi:His/Glu/Gln/Arg/opine family amino acid ABC transporter permease subunit